jgi:NADH dehydrogenase/NADH:ubiquinone oxidoreductase subunit G
MKKVTLEIDGKKVEAEDGMTILEAARIVGIDIPTLCYHEKLEPYGACRICSVEIGSGTRTRLVTACVYPVEENLVVRTKSERVIRARKMLLELMLARAPGTKVIQDLAREYGVERVRFETESAYCILCGLCVRYCAEVKKANAIGFIGRGTDREVAFIPEIAAKECPGCRECFSLCPTQLIQANFLLAQALIFPEEKTGA